MILLDQAGAGSSGARFVRPARTLEPLVEHFWMQQVSANSDGPAWRIVPDANPYLIFVFSRENPRCNVIGARSRFADVTMGNRIVTCGVRLRPGALPLLTRFPASDFTDHGVPIELVFGARGGSLMERLRESRSAFAALRVISDFLDREWSGRSYAARLPLGPYARVEDMAAETGLPVRTLHARLMQHVGLSPKRVLRIERLHRALTSSQARSARWARIAARAGFADQAHMIREFRDLLGESPTRWHQRAPLPICSRQ